MKMQTTEKENSYKNQQLVYKDRCNSYAGVSVYEILVIFKITEGANYAQIGYQPSKATYELLRHQSQFRQTNKLNEELFNDS